MTVPVCHFFMTVPVCHIDFDFIYKEIKDTYGINDNESVPPYVILSKNRNLATSCKKNIASKSSKDLSNNCCQCLIKAAHWVQSEEAE